MKARKRCKARQVVAAWAIVALCAAVPLPPAVSADSGTNQADLAAKAMSLQSRIFGKAPANQSLNERLEELEKYLLGKPQDGDSGQRLKHLQEVLDGKPRPQAKQSEEQQPVNDEIFDATKSPEAAPSTMPFTPDQADEQAPPKPEPQPQSMPTPQPTFDPQSTPETPSTSASQSTPATPSALKPQSQAALQSIPERQTMRAPKAKSQAKSGQKLDRAAFAKKVKALEERVFGHSDAGTAPETCLEHLETFVIGKPQTGMVERRLARVQGILDGTDPGEQNADNQAANQSTTGQSTTGQSTTGQSTTGQPTAGQSTANPDGGASAGNGNSGGASAGGGSARNGNFDSATAGGAAGGSANIGGASVGASSSASGAAPAHPLRGRVDTLAATYSLAGITLKSNTLPSPVSVKLGSRALRAGVMDNDRLLHAELGIDTLSLVLERNGHKFAMEVPLTDNSIASKLKGNDLRLNSGATATGDTTKIKGTAAEDWKVLKQYNIAVLLDVSGSMSEMQQLIGMSKNDWCRQEISSFASEAERLGSGTFDFGTFNNEYSLTPNCSAAQAVTQLVANPPRGGTNIAAPLQAAIDERYTKSANKPFLIVVITDGLPRIGEPLDTLIVRAAQHARSAGDIKIIFLQIGEGQGQVLADFLDTQLMSEGAPYDIVSSIEWDQLSRIGLRSGLIAALNKPAGAELVTDPQKIMQFDDLRNSLAISKLRFDNPNSMQQQRQMMRNFRNNPGGLINPGGMTNPGGITNY